MKLIRKSVHDKLEHLNLRFRIVLSFILIIMCATILIAATMIYFNRSIIEKLLEDSSNQSMEESDSEITGVFSSINQIYYTLNSQPFYKILEKDPALSDFQQMKIVLRYENELKESLIANNLQRTVTGIFLYGGGDNYTYIGNGTLEDVSVEEQDWYMKFKQTGDNRFLYGPKEKEILLKYANADQIFLYMRYWNIPESEGIRKAESPFIMFVLNRDVFEQIFAQFTGKEQGVFVKNENGDIFYFGEFQPEQVTEISEIIQSEGFSNNETYTGTNWFVVPKHNLATSWDMYTVQPIGTVFSKLYAMIETTIVITLLTLGVAILLWLLMSRKIVMPITTLNRLIATMEEENDAFITVTGKDELGQIGDRFNSMKRKIQEMNARMYLLSVQEKDAQLSALQSQINPHFLYNTLDNIYCIAQIEEISSIEDLSQNLSEMMRYSVDMKQRLVPVSKEIEHVKNYIRIINVRFDESIHLEVNVEEGLEDCLMLKLILQPLVENAWNHGILLKKNHRGNIWLHIFEEEDALYAEVKDDGAGITDKRCAEINKMFTPGDKDVVSQKGFGVALKNVNSRIQLYCGGKYGLHIAPGPQEGCVVTVKLRKETAVS
ncbi:MAG: sensor histidine kinase [Lachnospiraceae bacterium]|nr:sensor histidine kinase [Lachnospiraceae bacterium]